MAERFETELDATKGKEKFSLTIPPEDELKRREQKFRQYVESTVGKHPEYTTSDNMRQKGKFDEAERIVRDILSVDATYSPAYYELGLIYRDKRDFQKASESFNEAEKYCDFELVARQISMERASAEKELADTLKRTNPSLAFSHYTLAEDIYIRNLSEGRLLADDYVFAVVNYASLCFNLGRRSRTGKLYAFALGIIEKHMDIPKLANIEPVVRKYLADTKIH